MDLTRDTEGRRNSEARAARWSAARVRAALARIRWDTVVVVAVATAVLLFEARSTIPFVVDDSYITFTFSKNVALGRGPVYGHDMVVEGYSNFLWMISVALPLAVARHADPIVLARLVAVPYVIALLYSTYGLARRGSSRPFAALAPLLLALDQDFVFGFLSGLETLPYAAFVTTGFYLYLESKERPELGRYVVPVLAGAALTRIDGFVPLGFVLGYELLDAWAERRFDLRKWVRWAAPGVAVWALWFLWRYHHYGLPLPSTYYAKSLIPELLPTRGRGYVEAELTGSGFWVVLLALPVLLWRRRRDAIPLSVFAVGQVVYAAYVGGDWMPYGRFVLPAVPFAAVLLVWAGAELRGAVADRVLPVRGLAAAASLAVFVWLGLRVETHVTSVPEMQGKVAHAKEQLGHVETLKTAARYLSAVVPPGGRLVTDYGGVLAYYTQSTPIEMWGLCNATIARRGNTERVQPMYGKTCPACYPELRPEYFHTMIPMVRSPSAFSRHVDVVRAVWQTDTIGRYLDFQRGFVSGRVRDLRRNKAVWFLEVRPPGWKPRPRRSNEYYVVEYPFEPNGLLGG